MTTPEIPSGRSYGYLPMLATNSLGMMPTDLLSPRENGAGPAHARLDYTELAAMRFLHNGNAFQFAIPRWAMPDADLGKDVHLQLLWVGEVVSDDLEWAASITGFKNGDVLENAPHPNGETRFDPADVDAANTILESEWKAFGMIRDLGDCALIVLTIELDFTGDGVWPTAQLLAAPLRYTRKLPN